MPSKNLDPTKRFRKFRLCLAESWKSNVNVTSPALVNCTFVASLIWSMGEPQPVFIPSQQRYQRFDFMIPKTPRQRGLWVEVVSHIQEVLNTSPALMPKRKGRCFNVYIVHIDVVIPPHSPEVDPKDPRQSLRRASSFAPQRPLELCHQPLARSHRPWEAKALKIHHTPICTKQNNWKVYNTITTPPNRVTIG